MKITKSLLSVVVCSLLVTACARTSNTIVSEKGAVMPSSYSEGRACSVLGLFDNSVAKAAKNGGIKTVSSSTTAAYIFGLVTCTYAQGN